MKRKSVKVLCVTCGRDSKVFGSNPEECRACEVARKIREEFERRDEAMGAIRASSHRRVIALGGPGHDEG